MMQTTYRPAATSRARLGRLVTAALAVGTVSATAWSAGTAGATSGKQARATSGKQARATSGKQARATSGKQARATSGKQARATSGKQARATSGGKQVTVSVMTIGRNKILTADGKALYFLTTPSSVTCGSACLKVWPALTLPAGVHGPRAGSGVQRAKLGTTVGPNGQKQVTYGGRPVYWFAYDNARGKAKGNLTDKWGKWIDVVVSQGSSGSSGSVGPGNGAGGNSGASSAGSGGAAF